MSDYFENLQAEINRCYDTAHRARAKGFDPDLGIDAVPAGDLSARVEGLVGPVGIAEEIKRTGRENITKIIDAILDGKFDVPKDKLVEQALRTSLAILTEGVVAAPIEGISDVKTKENPDGSRYLSIYFAGPIRSAGGTAQGLAVLIGAYISRRLGLNEYRPTNDEIERYVEEIRIYNDRVTNLQYVPSEDDIRTIIKNVPVCIDGDPTEEMEVSIHRHLKRVETDRIRGGMCLVTAEGIAQKAKKLMKKAGEFGIDWGWLSELGKAKVESANEKAATAKFMGEVVGGRPILSEPSARGGFRLRYGRCRATGIAAKAIHPATAILLDGFIATGTQMRIEKPGKGCIATVCDEIEGPIVRLKGGNVVMVETEEVANEIKKDVQQILFLGDILVSYGDFLQTNTPLLPAGYCEEWWQQESGVSWRGVTGEQAVQISKDKKVPLHPRYTYRWEDVTVDDLKILAEGVSASKSFEPLRLEKTADVKRVLENIAVPHSVDGGEIIVGEYAPFLAQLGYDGGKIAGIDYKKFLDAFDAVSSVSTVRLRRKSGTYIGMRMGRPEKAKERKMQPAVHVLFPIGKTGGREQMVNVSAERKSIFVEVSNFKCPSCGKKTIMPMCECGERGHYLGVSKTEVMIQDLWRGATSRAGIGNVKGVEGMISEYKIPEPLEKGILRAKNEVFVFKDGTCRFDATDAPVTHVRPREIGVGVEKLRELGYEKDYLGCELKSDEQIIELFVQDIVVPLNGADYIIQVSRFVDDLLERFYAMEPYYRIENRQGLLGKLVVGLAPHTSAGIIGRVVGFTDANVCFAHPYWHTAKRRNCDGDEDTVMLLMDVLLNFSKKYLPVSRGGKMDAPLVITTLLDPKEVDDEVHKMEIVDHYPAGFYEKTLEGANPSKVKVRLVSDLLDNNPYSGIGFTHDTYDVNGPVKRSTYVKLKTMLEKVTSQLALAEKIRAIDEANVAQIVINSHFLRDTYGNLRAFSRQKFRCIKCNASYRRVPLSGKCKCGGRLLLTVSENTVKKYLEISLGLVEKYHLPDYLKQRLELLDRDIKSVFISDLSRQSNLSDFM